MIRAGGELRSIWPIPFLCGALACQPPSANSLDGTGTGTGTGTSTNGTGTSSESSDTSSESSDTSTDGSETTGEEEPDCADQVPGAEVLRCLDGYAGGLALDSGWLYFTYEYNGNEVLERMRDDGSDHELLADAIGDARTLQIVDGSIYWNDFYGGRVVRMPIDGRGPIEDVVSGLYKPNSYVIHEGMLYVTQYEGAHDLVRVSLDGGTPEVLYPALDFAGALHRHDQDLWWVTNTNNFNVGNQLIRGTLSGDPVEVFLADGGGVLTDETHLYWVTGRASEVVVHRMLHAGGAIEELLTLDDSPSLILADDYLYWRFVSVDQSAHGGEIHRMPKDGGPTQMLVEGQNYPTKVVVGGNYVYWNTQRAIARLALP
jgi:hypothetical protein